MSAEIVVFASSAGLLAAGAVVYAIVSARSRRRFQDVEAAWRRYAESKGMRFSRASGWHRPARSNGLPPALEAEVQGVSVDIVVQSTENGPMTRVEATLPTVSEEFLFAVYRRGSLDKIKSEFSDVTETPTGNKVFDAAFVLLSNDSDVARSILDRRLAHVIGDFPREFSYLYAAQTRFTLIWPGMEVDPAVLDAGVNLVWTACRRRA